ncbi:hypothetical protein CWIS_13630 [Cellulomonas sp. A375-1]|uniref:hypothetical protein n=1 Tax=Cellulomonas sp. A375-1 TaxID=1672219 RepID=UPI000652801F|nr:hypothetical protein [Cellulomonas sp. A375-1]KMM44865.1 hypothetical protein CWIS_13630 [Cellulomonas sp. A375-1]
MSESSTDGLGERLDLLAEQVRQATSGVWTPHLGAISLIDLATAGEASIATLTTKPCVASDTGHGLDVSLVTVTESFVVWSEFAGATDDGQWGGETDGAIAVEVVPISSVNSIGIALDSFTHTMERSEVEAGRLPSRGRVVAGFTGTARELVVSGRSRDAQAALSHLIKALRPS